MIRALTEILGGSTGWLVGWTEPDELRGREGGRKNKDWIEGENGV